MVLTRERRQRRARQARPLTADELTTQVVHSLPAYRPQPAMRPFVTMAQLVSMHLYGRWSARRGAQAVREYWLDHDAAGQEIDRAAVGGL